MTEFDVKGMMYTVGPKGERLDVKYIRGHATSPSAIDAAKTAEKYAKKHYKKTLFVTNVNIYRYRQGAEIVRFN